MQRCCFPLSKWIQLDSALFWKQTGYIPVWVSMSDGSVVLTTDSSHGLSVFQRSMSRFFQFLGRAWRSQDGLMESYTCRCRGPSQGPLAGPPLGQPWGGSPALRYQGRSAFTLMKRTCSQFFEGLQKHKQNKTKLLAQLKRNPFAVSWKPWKWMAPKGFPLDLLSGVLSLKDVCRTTWAISLGRKKTVFPCWNTILAQLETCDRHTFVQQSVITGFSCCLMQLLTGKLQTPRDFLPNYLGEECVALFCMQVPTQKCSSFVRISCFLSISESINFLPRTAEWQSAIIMTFLSVSFSRKPRSPYEKKENSSTSDVLMSYFHSMRELGPIFAHTPVCVAAFCWHVWGALTPMFTR